MVFEKHLFSCLCSDGVQTTMVIYFLSIFCNICPGHTDPAASPKLDIMDSPLDLFLSDISTGIGGCKFSVYASCSFRHILSYLPGPSCLLQLS